MQHDLDRAASAETLPALFFDVAAGRAKAEALRFKRDGAWQSVSYAQWATAVRRLAASLADRIGLGDVACILSDNRWEWTLADLAVLGLGGVLAPIYPTSPVE